MNDSKMEKERKKSEKCILGKISKKNRKNIYKINESKKYYIEYYIKNS